MKHCFFLFIITISALFTVSSCKERNAGRKTIAVSIPPQAALLHEIAGDSINIVTLMQSEANPEAFEVSVSNMRAVNDAALYMKMGNLAFEETLTDRIRQSNAAMHIADISEGIEPYLRHTQPRKSLARCRRPPHMDIRAQSQDHSIKHARRPD